MTVLYPYQLEGVEFLKAPHRFRYLADEMGLGKTPQAIRAAVSAGFARVLIVTRASLRCQWAAEWHRWNHGAIIDPRPPQPLYQLRDPLPEYGPAIASYDFVRANRARLHRWAPDLIILDEAQDVRSIDAQRTQVLFGRDGIARNPAHPSVWWLSGTPIENTPADLWLPLHFSGAFPDTRAQFLERYCELRPDGRGGVRPVGANPNHLAELRERLASCGLFLRRTKDQVGLQLPPLTVSQTFVESFVLPEAANIDQAQLSAEYKILAHALGDLSKLTLEALAELQVTAESVSTLLRYTGLLKVNAAVELAGLALESSPKLVVFFKHTDVGKALLRRLEHFRPLFIDGSVNPTLRDHITAKFCGTPDNRVLVAQLRAAGAGLNLQVADQCIVVETEWDSASLDQAIGRVHRIGSRYDRVSAQVLTLADDELDRTISRIITTKRGHIQEILR